MAKFNIEAISVSKPEFVKTARGGYNVLEVAYKKDGKVEGKKLVDFNNKAVFKAVSEFQVGMVYSVTSEKVNDFWQWTAVSPANEDSEQAVTETSEADQGNSTGSAPTAARTHAARGKVTGSNYETPGERALRRAFDVFKHNEIRRQSCLNIAISTLTEQDKSTMPTSDIIKVAEEFEVWVKAANA